eukprot:gene13655-4555_t
MASSDEYASSEGEVRKFKSYVQIPVEKPSGSREEREKRRSISPRDSKSRGDRRRRREDRRYSDSDEEYYKRKRRVKSFLDEKENKGEEFNQSPRDDGSERELQEKFTKQQEKRRDRGEVEEGEIEEGEIGDNGDKYYEKRRDGKDRDRRERNRDDSRRNRERQRERRRDFREDDDDYAERSRRDRRRDHNRNEDEEGALKSTGENSTDNKKEEDKVEKKKNVMDILTRTGGAYIPPARLRLMQESIKDKSSVEYQRMAWEALKKSINGLVNKINVANIANIIQELFEENIVRARGLFCQSVMRAQVASPIFTNVYSALISIVNTKFPKIGELILRRLILQFRRAFRRNDKTVCLNSAKFIAHLVNQQVAHELLSLEVLTLLLQKPTDDSVEVAVGFLKEVGQKLSEVSPRGLNAVFERLRNILNEGEVDKRVQYMLEVMFAVRKDGFKDHPAVIKELDLVEEDDQITHLLRLDDSGATEEILNVFKHDPDYEENEEKYKQIKKDLLSVRYSSNRYVIKTALHAIHQFGEEKMDIIDKTETNLVALRRTIYLTIQSSLDYEECAHKMMKMNLKPGQEHEFCLMIIDCCAQQRTFEKFFGLLAQSLLYDTHFEGAVHPKPLLYT